MSLNKHAWRLLPVFVVSLLLTGCYTGLDNKTRAGNPLVDDTLTARYERPPLEIWQAAKDVLAHNGTVFSEDTLNSTLEASVSGRRVIVQVFPLDSRVTELRVQTRTKTGGTDRLLAGELDKQIAIRLATGNLTPATNP